MTTQAEKNLLEVIRIKQTMKEAWAEIMPQVDDEQMSQDIACLTENFINHSHQAAMDECVTLMYASGLAYSELMAHRFISCQPVVPDLPALFFNGNDKDEYRLQSMPSPQMLRKFNLCPFWDSDKARDLFRNFKAEEFVSHTIDITSTIAREWDKHIFREIHDIAGYSSDLPVVSTIEPSHFVVALEDLCQRVVENSRCCANWVLLSSAGFMAMTASDDYVPCEARRYISGRVAGTWQGRDVGVTELPPTCLALVGHKGNTKFDAGFVFAPLYFSDFSGGNHGRKRLTGMATRLVTPNGEQMYGKLNMYNPDRHTDGYDCFI